MVNRRYLRTKVMQALFAHKVNETEDIVEGRKKLTESVQNCYILFLYFFSIFPELRRYRLNKLEELKAKINPTAADLNPNTKFVDNIVINQIEDSITLNREWKNNKVNWTNHNDVIVQIFQEVQKLEEFQRYMNNAERSYEEDKQLVLDVIEKVFVESTLIHWFFEEKNVHWFDDYNDALLIMYRNIQSFKESQGKAVNISPLFKNDDDVDFYLDLYTKTVINDSYYASLINDKLKNWEAERLLNVDVILMKMAICELTQFPTIPVKVIINEYIELAKTYSSAKSGYFINGILDKVIVQLRENGELNKMGRGLLDK
ncbi:transcription antitermination factor NusB [Bacteroidales bacterium OttesenSCG-928-B11]|nr:transcription antitermination factor NusB [Bacteroidales bacterium OttesenSCG-928-C03]MDL2311984.1 transcription antitermination factor NusB [Bacteroidales bacterium OttesenSCG-928-B11]